MSLVEEENQISIDSKPESIAEVESFIEQIRDEHEIGDELFANILISLTEAVNNGIEHGNAFDESKKVIVSCKVGEGKIAFKVADEGVGFDFNNLPDPTDPTNLEKITGRGVFLMKQLSDFLIYSFSSGHFVAEMQFKI